MKVVRKLDLTAYSDSQIKSFTKIFDVLNGDGINIRLVGGCVRDALLSRKIIDFDFACALEPKETMERLKKAGIKVTPTGLKHGTITALVGKHHFEITTLRKDIETDGRHAKVSFTDDWQADAERRDFTINALYLDRDGSLYDPCKGLVDLDERRVRFIGDPIIRIREDALRILRFFRFAAQIGGGNLDPLGLKACIEHKSLMDGLSGERLAQEFFKILKSDNVMPIMGVMKECGILEKLLPDHIDLSKFNAFVALENSLGRCDVLMRLSCLISKNKGDIQKLSHHLKLSNHETKILMAYGQHTVIIDNNMGEKDIRKHLYQSGRDVFIFALLDYFAMTKFNFNPQILHYSENWPIPIFPVTGADLKDKGFVQGKKLGQTLKKLEQHWIKSDFSFSHHDLMKKATEYDLNSDG
ncbi:MAG: CCA tRNA nucleotidyltransferase [Emcibacter sp.]|nr:CCA tRNA nucleotidyltransferase [Emcibacter sp.]